jgi:cell division protein FtsB
MLTATKQSTLRRLAFSPLAVLMLLFLAGAMGRSVWGVYGKSREAYGHRGTAQRQLDELQARAAFLETELAQLETDEGVEALIREKFPVVKPGEEVIVVTDEASSDSRPEHPPTQSLWKKIWPF